MMSRAFSIFLLIVCFTLATSCEETASPLCGGGDPVNDLPWLKQEINRLGMVNSCTSISRSIYKKQTVFIFSNCEPNINSIPFLYQCDGTRLSLSPADYKDLKFTGDIELIWKSN